MDIKIICYFMGHFLGLHAHGGQFNFRGIKNSIDFLGSNFSNLSDRRYQGWFVGAGVAYGYAFVLGRHWNLELDLARLAAYSLYNTKITRRADGKFVYKVAADREAERAFGYGTVLNADEMGVDQTGERKTIPFKTNTITSAGTITISSNKEQVVFYDKQFKVTNSLISGTIQYTDDGVTMIDVPQYDFVAFARTSDGTRIGSVNVGANGAYSLNLRKEYSFNWYTDAIEFNYIHPVTKKVYEAKVTSLNSLFASPNVVLAQP